MGLATYLRDLSAARSAGGLPEISGYPALSNLLNDVGSRLRPRVRTVIQVSNSGAGVPDGGFFTPDQLRLNPDETALFSLQPSRGVLEVKAPSEGLAITAQSNQVQRYLEHYGQILLTNYRDFALWHWENNSPRSGETYSLASSEADFWRLAGDPNLAVGIHEERLLEYLRRVLLSLAPLGDPKVLAAFLASYAREARARVGEAPLDALATVRTTLEESLGIQFTDDRGRHFFQSTFIQTLFYGVFSAWVLWHGENPTRHHRFRWRESHFSIGLPVLRKLFQLVADPQQLRSLGLEQVLDWAGDTLNRVDRQTFFARFELGEAVEYFYEPFLAEFDSELRTQYGVWFTPPAVVKYMVERVNRALHDDLGISSGLADRRVYVLDPCCGTGTYLFEVLKKIYADVKENSGEAQAGLQALEAARDRVFGFELLPAPYVIAHLRLDMLFKQWQTSFDPSADERPAIFLTNALTGWEPPEEPQHHLLFPELEAERDAADRVKREPPILVIIGNPPYSGFAGIAIEEERTLTDAYRTTRRAPRPQGQGLNDLYVRFFRMAERRIVNPPTNEQGSARRAQGIVCFISNYSWLDGLSHPGMRERFLEVFDRIIIDCMNGDKYETGKRTPDGAPDPSVFSTELNREGIQVGTAITTLVRKADHAEARLFSAREAVTSDNVRQVYYRDFWGVEKREDLLRSLDDPDRFPFESLKPVLELRLPFNPVRYYPNYFGWFLLTELMPVSFPGVKTSRDEAVIAVDRATLGEASGSDRIVRYTYRPFDFRWLRWSENDLLDRPRPEFLAQVDGTNRFLEARQRQPKSRFDRGYVTRHLADNFGNGLSNFFPLYLRAGHARHAELFESQEDDTVFNMTSRAANYIAELAVQPSDLFYHIVAILHSREYGAENADALRQDWPRIPLPVDRAILLVGSNVGREIAALLDLDTPVAHVTTDAVRNELRTIGRLQTIDRENQIDLNLTARWGYRQSGGVMPGPGRVERSGAACRVFLNDSTFWEAVPENVWEYSLGGYQVLKKWLSYRERDVLGRGLRPNEAMEFTNSVRRIAAILSLGAQLDDHYTSCREATTE